MDWQSTETAPKDRPIRVQRVMPDGRVIYDGPARWKTVWREALYHPIDGDCYAPAGKQSGFMYLESNKMVPWPTHWKNLEPPQTEGG